MKHVFSFLAYSLLDSPNNDRRMLTFEFSESEFNNFHALTKALSPNASPTFTINENCDLLISFTDTVELRFEGVGNALPQGVPFMLVGGAKLHSEDPDPQIVVTLRVYPADCG